MKVLLLEQGKLSTLHANVYYYLYKELAKKVELTPFEYVKPEQRLLPILLNNNFFTVANWKLGRKWYQTKRKLNKTHVINKVKKFLTETSPDIVLMRRKFVDYVKGCKFIKQPKALILGDAHAGIETIKKSDFNLILFRIKWWMDKIGDRLETNISWLPFSVNTNIFKDRTPKKYDVVSSGNRYAKDYPLRTKIYETLSKRSDINFCMPTHPKQQMKGSNTSKYLIRERYAKFLSQSKIFIFGSSIYNYPLQKYTEGMASNCLVLAPKPKDAKELHFIPNHNFVEINKHNFMDKIHYYLENEDERTKIVRNANETIKKYHTVEKRVKELVNMIKRC